MDIAAANAFAADQDPLAIIRHAIDQGGPGEGKTRALVSTNFRPGEAVLLHMCAQVQPDIPVLWVDHGYNTEDTYRCAERIIARLGLKVVLYTPRRTRAHREALSPDIPAPDTAEHLEFTEELKLEPFRRGLQTEHPDVWFTALRREQTAFRSGMDYFSVEETGLVDYPLLKVCPVLDWTEAQMEAYLTEHDLPDEKVYFDPTKVHGSRECGLHPGLGKQE